MTAAARVEHPTAPGPRTVTRCTLCGERVEARLDATGPTRVRYVFPVDTRGWCSACLLDEALGCEEAA